MRCAKYCLTYAGDVCPTNYQVTFGETSTGAAMVQGSFVAQGASEYCPFMRRILVVISTAAFH